MSKMATTTILKIFSCYLLLNGKSDCAESWLKALGQHGDSELLKWFHSDIQDGKHGSHLENLEITFCSRTVSGIELKLDGRH